MHELTDTKPRVRYGELDRRRSGFRSPYEFVFPCGKRISRDGRRRSIASTLRQDLFRMRLTRREMRAMSRCASDAHAVRTGTPFRDAREQQLSFEFRSATVDTLYRGAKSCGRQRSAVARKRIFSCSCPCGTTHSLSPSVVSKRRSNLLRQASDLE